MTTMTSQITSLIIVYSTVYSNADQRKHQSSASLAFVWGPVNSPHKGPVTRKMFPLDDVIMDWQWDIGYMNNWMSLAHINDISMSSLKYSLYMFDIRCKDIMSVNVVIVQTPRSQLLWKKCRLFPRNTSDAPRFIGSALRNDKLRLIYHNTSTGMLSDHRVPKIHAHIFDLICFDSIAYLTASICLDIHVWGKAQITETVSTLTAVLSKCRLN